MYYIDNGVYNNYYDMYYIDNDSILMLHGL